MTKKKLFVPNLRTRQELIGNNLMEVIDDYPDQLRVVIDELVSHLDNNQLDQIEDLIVNNYGEEVWHKVIRMSTNIPEQVKT